MRHRVAHRKLNRTSSHRKSMFANMAASLLKHEQIRTTLAKAKELRPIVEKLITLVKPYKEDQAGFATVELLDFDKKKIQDINLIFTIAGDTALIPAPAEIPKDLDYKIGLVAYSPAKVDGEVIIQPARLAIDIAEREFVVMQAKTFPLINILWLGILIMFIGTIMASFYRLKRK